MKNIIIKIIKTLKMIIPILIRIAFLVLIERKILGYAQLRKGPKTVGPFGLIQTIADGIKLFTKEKIKPSSASSFLFYTSPIFFLLISLILWTIIPKPEPQKKIELSLILILGISRISVYSLLGAGWSSKSKYSLIGRIRAVAQTISYEIRITIILLSIIILSRTLKLKNIIKTQEKRWFITSCLPLSYIWFISTLAETNRTPFDLTEGESELVSGYKVEYAGGPFALFFLAEYANIIFMKLLTTILFLGAKLPINITPLKILIIAIKTATLSRIFIWIRARFPRLRYDQLMFLTWKSYLPLSIGILAWKINLLCRLKIIAPKNI